MLDNKLINIWTIVYNSDPDCIYTFTSWSNVMRGIEGSIKTYLSHLEDAEVDDISEYVLSTVAKLQSNHAIPITVGGLSIHLYKWSLDNTNQIHKILSKAYDYVPNDVKCEILSLFS